MTGAAPSSARLVPCYWKTDGMREVWMDYMDGLLPSLTCPPRSTRAQPPHRVVASSRTGGYLFAVWGGRGWSATERKKSCSGSLGAARVKGHLHIVPPSMYMVHRAALPTCGPMIMTPGRPANTRQSTSRRVHLVLLATGGPAESPSGRTRFLPRWLLLGAPDSRANLKVDFARIKSCGGPSRPCPEL